MTNQSFLRYALAIVAPVIALLFMLALDPLIHLTQASFLLFFGAVTVTALYGGRNPGIVATLLAALFANYFFLAPQYSWAIDLASTVRILLFILQGILISFLLGALRKAQEQAQKNLIKIQASEIEIKKLNRELQRQVDELTLTEATLRASEKRFRRLVESNMFGVAFGDSSGGIHYANDYFLNMVGYSREDLLAGHIRWLDITPPELLYLDEAAEKELQKTGVAAPFEKEYIRKDGSRVPILIGATLLREPYDREQEIICFYIDLTERKQSEESLQQTLQKLTFHVENTPMAVIEWNRDLEVTRWSGAAERIFGWTGAEVLGKPLTDLHMVLEDDTEKVAEVSRRLMLSEEPYVFSYNRNYTKNGSIVHCEWYNSSLRDDNGRMISVLSLVLDITDRKQVEAEREQLLDRERTARTEAEAANRVKDEFLAVLSHELRSPLNPILGWARLLQTKKLDEAKVREALQTIERNARLQAELIEDLLDVSRILRGKLSLNLSAVDLATTIQAAIETVRLAAEAKSIQIETELEINVGQVVGDASRLQQIVWNLLSNAVKFTPEGGRVTVQLSAVTGHFSWTETTETEEQLSNPHKPIANPPFRMARYAQITVSDTGKGISPEFLPYVFEYFRQADSTITRRFGGLGLGLAIVRHLVELHGGMIRANSPGEGQGATFTVRLPLGSNLPPIDQNIASPQTLPSLAGIKILVVDDDADARKFAAFLLEQEQATVIPVASAQEALLALAQFQPDLLLSDIGMPDLDGYMLMQKIRSLPPEQGGLIPAIALTAYAGEYDQRRAFKAGFQKHLSKPVEPETLVKAVSELIEPES